MAKMKLGEDATVPADVESPVSAECYARISKHRSCWMHVVACMYSQKKQTRKKMTKLQADQLRSFESISPCFLSTSPFPRRKRSMRRCKGNSTITRVIKENKKLDSRKFNDQFETLWRSLSEDKKVSFTYFDSLWFNLYMKESFKGKVLTWIKKKRIFSKKYVLVPIVCWSHWSLLIFCHFGESFESVNRTPCMLLLDSLEKADPRRIEPDVRKFVLDIYRWEGRAEDKKMIGQIPLLVPKVPQQRNGEECGNFVLCFINLFVQGAPESFSIDDYPYFMQRNWFSPEHLDHFLEELDHLRVV